MKNINEILTNIETKINSIEHLIINNNHNLYSLGNSILLNKRYIKNKNNKFHWTICNTNTLPTRQKFYNIENNSLSKLKEYGLSKKDINYSQLFHGSTSSSLLAFTKYNDFIGHLKPYGQIISSNKIVFSGELNTGITKKGINNNYLSTVSINGLESALLYAYPKKYDLNFLLNHNLTFQSKYKETYNFYMKQRNEFDKLEENEKYLVKEHFPILYCIRCDRKNYKNQTHVTVISNHKNEIGLLNGAYRSEIKAIFVEENRILLVKNIVNDNNIKINVFTPKMIDYIRSFSF